MQTLKKVLLASGLVIMTSPLCLTAQAQDYVDVEAERAANANSAPAAPVSSYGASPATSYGMNNAPAAAVAQTSAPGSGGQNVSALFLQLQQLQQEVMRLSGKVEEQAHELRQLKQQSLERYMDLDKRMGTAAAAPVAGATAAATAAATSTAPTPLTTGPASAAELPGEAAAYNAAYSLVRNQQFDQAVAAFQQFQRDFPAGKYAPNSYYWLGELYLVVQPQDLESSRQSFTMLLNLYPDNSKAPDALYKLGKVQCMKGDKDRAREYLEQVISKYGSTNSSAVKLAREFNYETC